MTAIRILIGDRDVRALLLAVGVGVLVGGDAALGWARETPAGVGLIAFTGVLIGARAMRPSPRRPRRDREG